MRGDAHGAAMNELEEWREWHPFLFRHSGTDSEMTSQRPNSLSASASHSSRPSEVMRLPSKAASNARARNSSSGLGVLRCGPQSS
jgi:hypothetical protein